MRHPCRRGCSTAHNRGAADDAERWLSTKSRLLQQPQRDPYRHAQHCPRSVEIRNHRHLHLRLVAAVGFAERSLERALFPRHRDDQIQPSSSRRTPGDRRSCAPRRTRPGSSRDRAGGGPAGTGRAPAGLAWRAAGRMPASSSGSMARTERQMSDDADQLDEREHASGPARETHRPPTGCQPADTRRAEQAGDPDVDRSQQARGGTTGEPRLIGVAREQTVMSANRENSSGVGGEGRRPLEPARAGVGPGDCVDVDGAARDATNTAPPVHTKNPSADDRRAGRRCGPMGEWPIAR